MKRVSWDKYFFKIALAVAERSTCLNRKEGAVIVKDKRILSTGYNGAPVKLSHCFEKGCLREKQGLIKSNEKLEVCRGLDAIQNALIQAVVCGLSIKNSALYTSCIPSVTSAKMIINAGVQKIFMPNEKIEKLAEEILGQSKIKIEKIK